MCMIERFIVIDENGFRVPRQRLQYCPQGNRTTPCENVRVFDIDDLIQPRPRAASVPPRQNPRFEQRSPRRDSHHQDGRGPQEFSNGVRLKLNFWKPPSRSNTYIRHKPSSGSKPRELQFVRDRGRHPDRTPPARNLSPHRPPNRPQSQHNNRPRQNFPVVEVPNFPPPPPPHPPMGDMNTHQQDPDGFRSRRRPPVVQVTNYHQHDSPPPFSPNREHHRRARTLSPDRNRFNEQDRHQYTGSAALNIENLVRKLETAIQAANKEKEARVSAQRETNRLRHQRDQANQRNKELEQEMRKLKSDLNIERDRVAQAARQRQDDEAQRRLQEERERNNRNRMAGIGRQPWHPTEIHQGGNGNFEARGDQVINEDIRAANHGWFGRMRRRRPVPNREQIVYDDNRRHRRGRLL